MKIAILLGKRASFSHQPFDIDKIWNEQQFTGTAGTFFGLGWGLSDLGVTLDLYCDVSRIYHEKTPGEGIKGLGKVRAVWPVDLLYKHDEKGKPPEKYDVYISLIEGNLLRRAPAGALRVCNMLLNNFDICDKDHNTFIDEYVSPSHIHADHLLKKGGMGKPAHVIGLGWNPEFYERTTERDNTIIYCSSPDRGLHHLVGWFPAIRQQVPDAELHVYYRYNTWRDRMLASSHPSIADQKERAITIEKVVKEMGDKGENGLYFHGPVASTEISKALCRAKVMAYPCDPVAFTEGFSMATLESIAAGCHVVLSDADALPELYGEASHQITGNPGVKGDEWVAAIVDGLRNYKPEQPGVAMAAQYTRRAVASQWLSFLQTSLESSRSK